MNQLVEVSRVCVELERRVREVEGATYKRFKLDADSRWVKAVMTMKQKHGEQVKRVGKDAGSPHVWAMAGLLDTMQGDGRVTAEEKVMVNGMLKQYTDPTLLEPLVSHCKMKLTFTKEHAILQYKLSEEGAPLQLIMDRLLRADAEELNGVAPRGPGARAVVNGLGRHWKTGMDRAAEEAD